MYDTYLITLIDILGFKRIVHESHRDRPEKISEILSKFRTSVNEASAFYGTYNGEEFQMRYFSDLIVRFFKITGLSVKDVQGILYYELTNLGWEQGCLFNDGIFIRGAIDIGKLFVDDDYLFGDVFNAAYEMESKISKFPIILVSDNIIDIINSKSYDLKVQDPGVYNDFQNMVSNRHHSHNYIDFMLQSTRVRGMLDKIICDSELMLYRDVLKQAISENTMNPDILAKLFWLKEYYNYTVFRHKDVLSSYKKLLLHPQISKKEKHIGHFWMCSQDCARTRTPNS